MKSLHCFLHGRSRVEAVDLQQVDIGQVESLQTGIDALKYMLTTQSVLVYITGVVLFIICHSQWLVVTAANACPHFGCDDNVFPAPSECLDRLAEKFFRHAIGIGVCGVEEVKSRFIVMIEHWQCLLFRK